MHSIGSRRLDKGKTTTVNATADLINEFFMVEGLGPDLGRLLFDKMARKGGRKAEETSYHIHFYNGVE